MIETHQAEKEPRHCQKLIQTHHAMEETRQSQKLIKAHHALKEIHRNKMVIFMHYALKETAHAMIYSRKSPECLRAKLRICPVITLVAGVRYTLAKIFYDLSELLKNFSPLPPPSTSHCSHPSPRGPPARTSRRQNKQDGPSCAPVAHT